MYYESSELNQFFNLFQNDTKRIFALELYNDDDNKVKGMKKKKDINSKSINAIPTKRKKESRLHVGGYDFIADEDIKGLVWTESGMWREDYLNEYPFPLYHLSICGVDLMQQISSQMDAVISTGEKYLQLPSTLWKMITRWVGANCTGESLYPPKQPLCFITLDPHYTVHDLPPLRFQLSEFGNPFFIPLSLLLKPTQSENVFVYLFLFLFFLIYLL